MTRSDQRASAVRRRSKEARMKRVFNGVVASYIRDISVRPGQRRTEAGPQPG